MLDSVRGRVAALTTWAWDFGPIAGAGRLGEIGGYVSRLLRPRAVPCVAIHPVDVGRGYLERALSLVRSLRATGHEPRTLESFV